MTEEEFFWEEPPPAPTKRSSESRYVRLVEQLRKNPGKWALARDKLTKPGARNLAFRLNVGGYGTGIEATYVLVGERANGWSVYARFVSKPVGRPVRRRKS